MKKIVFAALIIIVVVFSFMLGTAYTHLTYRVTFAGCRLGGTVPSGATENIIIEPYMERMLRNFYGPEFTFKEHVVPIDVTLKEYYSKFNRGGFHYFLNVDGVLMTCGLYK